MISTALFIGLAAIASASPISLSGRSPSISKGFNLIVNVTDLSRDFSPSIHGLHVVQWHMLANFARAHPYSTGPVFYQNGTSEDKASGNMRILTDLGGLTASLQYSRDTAGNVTKHEMEIDMGVQAGPGMMISEGSRYLFVEPQGTKGSLSTFVVCNETVEWISHNADDKLLAIDFLEASVNENGQYGLWIPDECVPVNLLPQCATLPDVTPQEPPYPNHEFAQNVPCYGDVSAITWQ